MNVTIFYFSGTGNTWWTSLELKKQLESLGNTVEVFSLENPMLKEKDFITKKAKESDHIIIGYPVYGSDLPDNMWDLVNKLPNVKDKGFSAFCTQAGFSGDGTIFFKPEIEKKGFKFLQNFWINMPTNFNVAMFPFSLFAPAHGKKLEKKKAKAIKKLKIIAKKITENIKYTEGTRFYQLLLGKLQRYYLRRGRQKFVDKFQFAKERCTKCKICVNTCPTNNIALEESENEIALKRGNCCILCFRCYNFCPENAINFGGKIKNPDKYKRFTGPIKNMKLSDIRK